MTVKWLMAVVVAVLASRARASQCYVDTPHALRSEFAGADLVVLGTPLSDADEIHGPAFLEVVVERTYKGVPVRTVTVEAWCGSCERSCFLAGVKVLLFLQRAEGEAWSLRPWYHLRTVAPHPVVARKGIETIIGAWTDIAGGAVSLAEFERLARDHAYEDQQPPLTWTLRSGEAWPYRLQ